MSSAFGAMRSVGPWQGGLSRPVGPPSLPQFGTGTITIVSQTDATSGSLVSYLGGFFTAQFWTTGHPVPFLIRELDAEDVKALRDEIDEQLRGPSTGLDETPLRAFVAAADAYVASRSDRFSGAVFGAISHSAPGELLGVLSWHGGAVGTVLGSEQGISGQSHIPSAPAGDPAPLRQADLQSLICALRGAERASDRRIDPLWRQVLSFAEQAVAAIARRMA